MPLMSVLDGIYFVQRSRSDEAHGWETFWVNRDEVAAAQMAEAQEKTQVWVDGEDVTEKGATVTRVMTADQIVDEAGIDGLIDALARTRIQMQQLLDAKAD
jgi:hypothetical protein